MTFANRPERRHLVVVSDEYRCDLYGPFESAFEARRWAQRHADDFPGRRLQVTPATPIPALIPWLVTFEDEEEYFQFRIDAVTDRDAEQLAAALLANQGKNPARYRALVVQA